MHDICDLEIEVSVLAALLANPALLDEVDPVLAGADFSDPMHQRIFGAMRDTAAEAGTFTPLSLKRKLADVQVAGVSPVEYLTNLETHYGHAIIAVPQLALQLIDFSRRRTLIRLCADLSESAASSNAPTYMELLERVEDQLYHIPTSGEQFKITSAADGADESLAAARLIMESGGNYGTRADLLAWNQLVGPMLPGDMVVIGGTTSAGKTALAQQIAYEVARREPVLVFSLEMTLQQWVNRYLAQATGIPTEKMETGSITDEEYNTLCDANERCLRDLKMVVTDRPCLSVSQMRSFCKRVRRKKGALGMVVIDHLQFVTPPGRLEGPAATAAITRDIKAMAKDLGAPVILVSHLNRDISQRDNKRPVLSDLFGSSAIEKDADCVLFVHREHYWVSRQGPKISSDPDDWMQDTGRQAWLNALDRIKNDAELILAKRRRGKGEGSVQVNFDLRATKFSDRVGRIF